MEYKAAYKLPKSRRWVEFEISVQTEADSEPPKRYVQLPDEVLELIEEHEAISFKLPQAQRPNDGPCFLAEFKSRAIALYEERQRRWSSAPF